MKNALLQLLHLFTSMPLSRKVSILFTLCLIIAGFITVFLWTNQVDYQVLFSDLSPQDAGAIVSKLKEKNVPHRIERNGTLILVPSEKVYDLRLSLAGDGLPNGGSVGFEIFDKTDFSTTSFVQELNYKRALEGELSRTINRFEEVSHSRVFIVLPKKSLFVEESRPSSASIQLELKSTLPASKAAAIVHLVASAVEGLDPDQVTVVDTKGRVLFKGGRRDEEAALLSNTQIEYRRKIENEIRGDVQSLLEAVVGPGKAIVRVNAEIDFNKVTSSEEEFDPTAAAVRSKRDMEEASKSEAAAEGGAETIIQERRGILGSPGSAGASRNKKDVTTNYEISKITRSVIKPAGTIKRLSVATAMDGHYKTEAQKDGTMKRTYVPRSDEEIRKFEALVKRAMGFSEDRGDQVSVMSMAFSDDSLTETPGEKTKSDWKEVLRALGDYKRTFLNGFLVILVFLLVVRPLIRSMKKMPLELGTANQELTAGRVPVGQISESVGMPSRDRVLALSKENPEKAVRVIKGWVSE